MIRARPEITSERIQILPVGSRVHVLFRRNRRVCIDEPVKGWCSMATSTGIRILAKVTAADANMETPRTQIDIEQQTRELQEKIESWEQRTEVAQTARKRALSMPGVQENLERMKNLEISIQKAKREDSLASGKHILRELKTTKSQLDLLTGEKDAQNVKLLEMQTEVDVLQKELEAVCLRNGVQNPKELSDEIDRLRDYQEDAEEKIVEYELIHQESLRELAEMKRRMEEVLSRPPPRPPRVGEHDIHVGDIVMIKDGVGIVVVRYIGSVHWDPEHQYVGVELSGPLGNHDGTVDGKEYFAKVKPNYGEFYRMSQIQKKILPEVLLKELHKVYNPSIFGYKREPECSNISSGSANRTPNTPQRLSRIKQTDKKRVRFRRFALGVRSRSADSAKDAQHALPSLNREPPTSKKDPGA